MFHYFDALTNIKGDSLVGYQVGIRVTGTGAVVPIYADGNGTPIISVSGIANAAITDAAGNYSFFVPFGSYDILFSTPLGVPLKTVLNVPMNSGSLGPKGDPGGNVMSTGALAVLANQTILSGSNLIKIDGNTTAGDRGAGRELVATTATTPANDALTFADAAGRNFRQSGLARDIGLWVTWFGAKCDGVLDTNGNIVSGTDDTLAVQAAVNYAVKVGVSDIWFPDGVCIADNIAIPATSNALEQRMIRFRGARKPMQLFGTVGTIPVTTGGSVVKCRTGAQFAVFYQAPGPFFGFSLTFLEFVDLRIVTYDSPKIDAIRADNANALIVRGCQIDTGIYCVQGTEPVTYTYQGATQAAVGIRTPKRGNGAIIDIIDTSVSGYFVGITVNEHTRMDRVRLTCNFYGMEILSADHPSLIGKVASQRNKYHVLGSGPQRIDFTQMAFEDAAASQVTPATQWQQTVAHVQDPSNFIFGKGRSTRVIGGTGYVPGLIVVGGANLSWNDIGATGGGALAIFTTSPTVQSIPNAGAGTYVSFAATGSTVSGFALDPGDATKLLCTTTGVFEVDYTAGFDAASTGAVQVILYKNAVIYGRNQGAVVGFPTSTQARCYMDVVTGDVIRALVYQTSGGPLNLRVTNGAGSLNVRPVK